MINKITRNGLCLGCGMCTSILGEERCKMKLFENGFYYPVIKSKHVNDEIITKLCPGIVVEDEKNCSDWGNVIDVKEAWANDDNLRFKAASGGVTSALAIYLLEHRKVDAILQVGVKDGDYLYNELKVSKNRNDVLKNAQSRYAPAMTMVNIKSILDNSGDIYAFIGKPCDIAAIRNLCKVYPEYSKRFKYLISIFCAGMPSYNATIKTWKQSGYTDEPQTLKYRGEGWPGTFKAVWKDTRKYELSYNNSWGKVLGRDLAFRCKICPDGIGLLADIATGDSWNTRNGYPDFSESDGRNFCFIRSEKGRLLFDEAVKHGYIEKKDLDIDNIKEMQQYQYQRRHTVGWRIIVANLVSVGLIRFKGIGYMRMAMKTNFVRGVWEMKGTLLRMIRNKKFMKKLLLNSKHD